MKRGTINMMNQWLQNLSGAARIAMVPLAMLALWATHAAYPALAEQSAAQTFPSPTEASQTLLKAVQSNDEPAITKILGGPTDLTSSRDPGQDRVDRELFVQKY